MSFTISSFHRNGAKSLPGRLIRGMGWLNQQSIDRQPEQRQLIRLDKI
jgi:hypothetical protein